MESVNPAYSLKSFTYLQKSAWWFANFLSLSRLIIGLVFFLIPPPLQLGFLVYAVASEFFDGQVARKFGVVTRLGQFLDPTADKIFFLGFCFTLLYEDILEVWEISLLLSRDFIVVAGFLWLLAHKNYHFVEKLTPRILGKIATTLQFGFLVFCFVTKQVDLRLLFATSATCLVAAFDYSYRFFKKGYF